MRVLPTQQCTKCKEHKPLEDFSLDGRVVNKRQRRCKVCKATDARERRKVKKETPNESRVKRLSYYGLTIDEYEAHRIAQQSRCAICRRPAKLVVDHCHKTGTVRGFLCQTCNSGIGMLRDDPELVRQALDYLEGEKIGRA